MNISDSFKKDLLARRCKKPGQYKKEIERMEKRKYNSISSIDETRKVFVKNWLTFANVELSEYGSNWYVIYSNIYNNNEPSHYHFCDLEYCDYQLVGEDEYDGSFENVKPDRERIPETIYGHTCDFRTTLLSEGLIKRLDAIITKGDLPARGRFGVSSWLRKKDDIIPEDRMITFWMSYLKSFIPVVVVDEETMAKHDGNYCDPNEPGEGSIKPLAIYFPNSDFTPGPCIAICLDRVKKTAGYLEDLLKNDESLKYLVENLEENLCIIVLLHELAHAIMDPTNDLEIEVKVEKDEKGENQISQPTYIFGKKKVDNLKLETEEGEKGRFAMEESLANMIMLRYCELQEDSNLFEIAKVFVGRQTISYRFGLKQFEAADGPSKIDWSKWREAKSKNKINEKNLNEWNKLVVKYKKEDVKYSVSDYNDIFKENTEEENSKEE